MSPSGEVLDRYEKTDQTYVLLVRRCKSGLSGKVVRMLPRWELYYRGALSLVLSDLREDNYEYPAGCYKIESTAPML